MSLVARNLLWRHDVRRSARSRMVLLSKRFDGFRSEHDRYSFSPVFRTHVGATPRMHAALFGMRLTRSMETNALLSPAWLSLRRPAYPFWCGRRIQAGIVHGTECDPEVLAENDSRHLRGIPLPLRGRQERRQLRLWRQCVETSDCTALYALGGRFAGRKRVHVPHEG